MSVRMPKKGEEVYIGGSCSISHGSTDFAGGLCKISNVVVKECSNEYNTIFIEVEERQGVQSNWRHVLENQDKWKEAYGDQRGHPDPDEDRPWIEEGDIVDGKKYKGPPIW